MKYSFATATCGAALAVAFATTATTATAQSLQCGEPYTVAAGDSLSKLAAEVYDDATAYQIIYSANAAAIGPNPGNISVGLRLDIPCLGNTVASTAAPITQDVGVERLPFPNDAEIRILQGTGWAPFSNEDQEQGGMLTEIANVAMTNAAGGTDYKIDFVNDWGAHLTPLITDNAYDLALGWFKPNCAVVDRLGEDSQFRCNNFDWTEPLFEQLFGYYTRASDPRLSGYDDIIGKTVCRPAGYATFQLEENDLQGDNITLVRPVDPAECFTALVAGDVDVVALAVDTAEGLMVDTGTADQIVNNENINQVLTLHALTSKNNPRGEAILAEFNSGLNAIKENGEWFEIVRRHLTEFRAMTSDG